MALNYEQIRLRQHQEEHYQNIVNTIQRYHGYIDTSTMGCGKTVVTTKLSIDYGLPMIIVCTCSGKQAWLREQRRYGSSIVAVITYQSLRSVTGKQPKHGLLNRHDLKDENNKSTVSFSATDLLLRYINSGILFVMDEIQKIKNNSDQYKACKAITHAIVNASNSRFACLSGSPFDQEKQCVNLLKLLGIVRSAKLFVHHKDTGELKLYGTQELIDFCNNIDPIQTERTISDYSLNPKNVAGLCFRLYVDVVMKAMCSSMPPLTLAVNKDVANGYYNMGEEEADELNRGIRDLSGATRYDDKSGNIDGKQINWGCLTKALIRIELAKVGILIRLAKRDLDNDPNCKVVVFVNYIDTINQLSLTLQEYSPLILFGGTKEKDRPLIVHAFQNIPQYRLLIGNIKVLGKSIDLHQATGRIYRDGSLSDALIRFVYGKTGRKETSILDALSRKKDVLKKTLEKQVEAGILFPGEYPEDVEDEQQ